MAERTGKAWVSAEYLSTVETAGSRQTTGRSCPGGQSRNHVRERIIDCVQINKGTRRRRESRTLTSVTLNQRSQKVQKVNDVTGTESYPASGSTK